MHPWSGCAFGDCCRVVKGCSALNADTQGSGGEARGERHSVHVPVLLEQTLTILDLRSGLVVVDGTVGAGGHATGIASAIGPDGHESLVSSYTRAPRGDTPLDMRIIR